MRKLDENVDKMLEQITVSSLLIVAVFVFVNGDYCHIKSCKRLPNTMCVHKNKPAARCNKVLSVGLTQDEKDRLLEFHNTYRQKVARGEEKRGHPGPQPGASDMEIMEWDDELELVAQTWANQCDYNHDPCRDVERFPVGQNIGYEGTTGDIGKFKVEDLAQMWYDEVKDFSRNEISRLKKSSGKGPKVGHYTQFVWAKSNKLGCGAIKYVDENPVSPKNMFKWSAIFLLLIITNHAFANQDYCNIRSCRKRLHTMCEFNNEISSNCKDVKEAGLTEDEKQRIVKYHNELRHKVANGEETRGSPGPQLATQNMKNLEWDDELAEIAQVWANQCTRGQDECRDVERFEVGQNTAFKNSSGYIKIEVEDLIKGWYDEVKHLNRKYVFALPSIFSSRANRVGHYTQIVWAKTTRIGCGMVKSKDGWFGLVYLVCNYGVAGNELGEPVYDAKVRTLHRYLSGFFDNYEYHNDYI